MTQTPREQPTATPIATAPIRPGWPEVLAGLILGAAVPLLLLVAPDALSADPVVCRRHDDPYGP